MKMWLTSSLATQLHTAVLLALQCNYEIKQAEFFSLSYEMAQRFLHQYMKPLIKIEMCVWIRSST